MRLFAASLGVAGVVLAAAGAPGGAGEGSSLPPRIPPVPDEVVADYCVGCHNERRLSGNLSLEAFEMASSPAEAPTVEKMIVKLRAGMMPPPGARRPGGDTLLALVETLEGSIDRAASRRPTPGTRTFQRLNRAEYGASIREVLGLEIDAANYLPPDTKSANFDNIADVQLLSPTLMDAYLSAAGEIARLAVGDPQAVVQETTFEIPRLASQRDWVPGAPYGSRGGLSLVHNFPADASYAFRVSFHHSPEGFLFGRNERGEQVEVSVNGERVALLPIDRLMSEADPGGRGLVVETPPLSIRAGPQRISVVFIPTERGPVDDLFSLHGHSIPDTQIGIGYGVSTPPHIRDVVIRGPTGVTGVSGTPSRRKVFTCRPTSAAAARPCAESIVERLATRAYRRPLDDADRSGLMRFYDEGASQGGFEHGVRRAIEAMLVSPRFVFRIEDWSGDVGGSEAHPIGDYDLASRLSFFLWGGPPDDELLDLARRGRLARDGILREQTRRMLADPRAEALGHRFAAQWLRLQDVKKVQPDAVLYPDYSDQLGASMRRETEMLFEHIVREDRPAMELLTADYTFVDERLAEHYGIPDVIGPEFRRVDVADPVRHGILGHGSVLTQTSLANRTSPVLRGKWVMEVLLGTPPPPPPPGVPDLEETEANEGTRQLTTSERMALHRSSPSCNSCHRFIDPIGLALDNFDVIGQVRIRENGMPVSTRGELYDGTPLSGPADLRAALERLRIPVLRNFTSNLMAYGLGRRVEYYDMPEIRRIVRDAEESGGRMSSFVLGVVESPAFRMRSAPQTVAPDGREPSEREENR